MRRYLKKFIIYLCVMSMVLPCVQVNATGGLTQTEWEFNYTGDVQEWVCPVNGVYMIEAYGASGGGADSSSKRGWGGKTTGEINILSGDTFYIYVGEHGTKSGAVNPETFNGGGVGIQGDDSDHDSPITYTYFTGSGGGATDIRKVKATSGWYSDSVYQSDSSLSSRILVAGGGGGLHDIYGELSTPDSYSYGNSNTPGNGTARGSDSYKCSDSEGRITGFYSAAGGGGYSGGNSYGNQIGYGQGGSGYVSTDFKSSNLEQGVHFGHGKLKITYIEPIKSTLTLHVGDDGYYNGVNKTFSITKEYGETLILGSATRDNYTFSYWTDLGDDAEEPAKILSGTEYVFGFEDSYYTAHFRFSGEVNIEVSGENTIHVDGIDDGLAKYYVFYSSDDGGSTFNKVNINGSSFSDEDVYKEFNYNGGVYTYEVKSTGRYKLTGSGGEGSASVGGSAKCPDCKTRYYDATNSGGKGNSCTCEVTLRYGDILYIRVGGAASGNTAGYPNGGAGSPYKTWLLRPYNGSSNDSKKCDIDWEEYRDEKKRVWTAHSGAGGGGTDFRLNIDSTTSRIFAVGGGGGGYIASAYYYLSKVSGFKGSGYQGGVYGRYTSTDKGQDYVLGQAESDDDGTRKMSGGGGGGWFGGGSQNNGSNGVTSLPRVNAVMTSEQNLVRSGNGFASILFLDTDVKITNLDADFKVNPNDDVAPDAPEELNIGIADASTVSLDWNDCDDNGKESIYYLEVYEDGTDAFLYNSNKLDMYGLAGTKGYYYYVDTTATSKNIADELLQFNDNNYSFSETSNISIPKVSYEQYLHVATVDNNYNVSETVTFEIPVSVRVNYDANATGLDMYYDEMPTNIVGSMPSSEVLPSQNYTILDSGFSLSNYLFKGWNTKSDGTGRWVDVGRTYDFNNLASLGGKNLVLYAQWEPDPITYWINYNGNTSTEGELQTQTCRGKTTHGAYANWYKKDYDILLEPNGSDLVNMSNDEVILYNDDNKPYLFESWTFLKWSWKYWNFNNNRTGELEEHDIAERLFTQNEAFKDLVTQHKAVLEFNAIWEPDTVVLPDCEKRNCKFLGWFDTPQGDYGDTVASLKVGDAGDVLTFEKDMTLYAWFNNSPSAIDIYEGTFYEGQEIGYSDLLKLIGVSDFEDDYRNAVDNLLDEIPTVTLEPTEDEEDFEYENDEVEIPDYGLTEEEKEELNASVAPHLLKVNISEIRYTQEQDGVSFADNPQEYSVDYLEIFSNGLDTKTDNIGYFYITYTVTDDGIYNGTSLVEESPITLYYTRKCKILYNNTPKLYLPDTIFLYEEDNVDSSNCFDFFKSYVTIRDSEDFFTNLPWWCNGVDDITGITDLQVAPGELRNNDTLDWLYERVTIPNVYEVTLQSGVSNDYHSQISNIDTLDEIFAIYGTDLWKAITSFKIEVNTEDQFGKYSSKEVNPYFELKGVQKDKFKDFQTLEDRSIQVININSQLDVDMLDSNVYSLIRYISDDYLSTLDAHSYWLESGSSAITSVLEDKSMAEEPRLVQTSIGDVNVIISDYSD